MGAVLVARVSALAVSLSCLPLLMGVPASAADLYGPPGLKDVPVLFAPALWQGLYLGGHIGGVWSNVDITDTYTYYGDPTARNSARGGGLTGGIQAGYNRQSGSFVYGVEGDLGYLNLSTSKAAALVVKPAWDQYWLNGDYTSSGDLYGDITGRIGYTTNRALFFVKGGVAFLNADFNASYVGQNYSGIPHTFNFSRDDMLFGWTVGAGGEYSLSQEWSVKLEYQHFDFGSTSYDHNGVYVINPTYGWHSTLTGKAEASPAADAVTLGVNYHLNWSADLN